jgi:hypothetical protein
VTRESAPSAPLTTVSTIAHGSGARERKSREALSARPYVGQAIVARLATTNQRKQATNKRIVALCTSRYDA